MKSQKAKPWQSYLNVTKKQMLWATLALVLMLYWSCGITARAAASSGTCPQIPDYQKADSWVYQAPTPDKPVDVFYIYPTIYGDISPANMDINNASLRKTAEHLMDAQAGAYSKAANLFAPYYRQMSFAKLDPESDMFQNKYFKLGYSDVTRAFTYFLENLNQGRPFIFAGHSQGAMVLINLMRDQFNNPELQKKLVAAYLIGYSVTQKDFTTYPWMKPATGATDTGVIISYNTQSPDATESPVLLPGAYCINPLNWTTDGTPADKSLNLGAVFFNDTTSHIDREVLHYTGARVNTKIGALIATPPDTLNVGDFPPGVYHRFDYALWYRNLQANVALRCRHYLDQNKK